MNILMKLTKRNLILNRKRTITRVIGIILSVALICAVSGMFTSFRETLIENDIAGMGYYHIAINGVDQDDLKRFRLNKDVKDVYTTYVLGTFDFINVNDVALDFTVYSLSRDDFDSLSYKILEGSFPSNSDEVLISESLKNETDYEIGDYIDLNFDNTSNKKYKITGITHRRKNSFENFVITTGYETDNIWAYLSLNKPRDYKNSFMELLGVNDYDELVYNYKVNDYTFVINNNLLRWEVFAFSDSTISMLLTVVSVVIAIILIVSVFCISASFAISTTEKMKMYGMLSSVGATQKQIKKSVLLEGLILGLVGIPLGILCGFLAVFILIKVVNLLLGEFLFNNLDGLVFKVSFLPIFLGVVLGFLTIYFSSIRSAKRASKVSPIENLRSTNDIKISSKKLKVPKMVNCLFKTGGMLAYKNLRRSKRKYRVTVISLTISIFVFIAMFSFINNAFEEAGRYYQDYTYNMEVYVSYDDKVDDIDKILNINEINKSYLLYDSLYSGRVLDNDKINYYEDDNDTDLDIGMSIIIMSLNEESFKEYTGRLGLKYDDIKNKGILINEHSYYSNIKNKEVITDRYKYKKGDIVNMKYENTNGTINELSVPLALSTYLRPIGLENVYYQGGYLIVNKDYYKDLDFYLNKIMIETDAPNEVEDEIEKINNMFSINNFTVQAQNERAMVIVISIFLYGFIVVITLIGVTNIFNTLTSNMELRQKEFAMLKSIGMTKQEFNRMINLETLFYSVKSLIYGIILGILGSYLIHLGFSEKVSTAYSLPLKAIVISIIFVFVIVYIIMKYSMSKINKQNIIETIRKENI